MNLPTTIEGCHELILKQQALIEQFLGRIEALEEQTKKISGSVQTFGLEAQTVNHFAFLHHTNFKVSTICMSLDEKGSMEPYGGPRDFPLAEANVLFYKMKYSSLFPSHSTLSYFNNTLYYCFYRKAKNQYYFASLK